MRIHDWQPVDAGLFHHFHQRWVGALADAFNAGLLPDGYYALTEQRTGLPIPDVLTLHLPSNEDRVPAFGEHAVAVADAPPATKFILHADEVVYAQKADRVVIKHLRGDVTAVIEIMSPGNKHSQQAIQKFVDKAIEYLEKGVHLLIIDLFPPTRRDPQGIHPILWQDFDQTPFSLPADKPLTLAAYVGGLEKTAYVEPVAVGDELPSMPLFLTPDWYVRTPLAETYELTWSVCPKPLKDAVLQPARH